MIRVWRSAWVLAVAAAVSCSQPASPVRPGGHVVPIDVSGKVHDGDGRDIGQARITAVSATGRADTTSDDRGEYRLQIGDVPHRLEVERVGYEGGWHPVLAFAPSSSLTRNLRLHPITRMGVGASLSVSILPEDAHCVYDVVEAAPCRRVRVVSSTAVRVIVDALDAFGETPSHEVWLQTSAQTAQPGYPLFLTINAGSETMIEVLAVRLGGASAWVGVRLDDRPQ